MGGNRETMGIQYLCSRVNETNGMKEIDFPTSLSINTLCTKSLKKSKGMYLPQAKQPPRMNKRKKSRTGLSKLSKCRENENADRKEEKKRSMQHWRQGFYI